ncbi:protein CHROMATIN REMODELING 4-like isoform X2 [Cucumis melo]|uniref:Protein CHROMATIN REMODELING 4-like isoform X2 n=1 Tax=Cucumis melo TaxID=3656 RepID=A0A1S3CFV4_CUCME|nr:protein CHROMATIN REMODELING 4-like isoform X2 [Cucumis melo]
MRIKNRRGGRCKPSRPSATSTTPSPMASPPLPDQEASNKETNDVLDKVDCFQKDSCTRCDQSGDLLVCTEPGCPIALHELCMSCEPSFDEDGRFYCPYCSYKRALIRVNELRRKTMVAKRALSDFIDTRMVGGGNSPRVGEAGKKKSDDISTCGVDVDLPNYGSHLCNESSRDQDIQVEQNQSNEGENFARAEGDVQPTSMVGVNSEIHDGPIVSNVSNDSHSAPVVQPCEDKMDEETHEAETSGTHQVKSLEDKDDGKTMDEEILRPIDDIQDDRIAEDQGQLEIPGAYQDGEETAQDKDDGREQIQPDNERMLENIIPASVDNDLKNETTAKKRRFKTKANRRTDLQNVNSPRKSLRLQTPEVKKSPHIRTPEPRKNSPHIQTPKPQKDHAIKIEKVSVSRNLKPQSASHNHLKSLDFHGGKRKRMRWSVEEEEMLREGVQKFSSTANKNLPWRKILEFGRHIFDDTRTPVDLKDKWRNLLGR